MIKPSMGFVIPPRTVSNMLHSAMNGFFSLIRQKNRTKFVELIENSTIEEEVLSQATAGRMMMLSLFHDLQNPLFKKHKFDPLVFLEGLVPSLENFHNISGALANELYDIKMQVDDNFDVSSNDNGNDNSDTLIKGDITKKDREQLLSALQFMTHSDKKNAEKRQKVAETILNHGWMQEGERNPESIAASLSRMVTKELFQINQLSTKTAFLLQSEPSRNIMFSEGSCQVNNVALLSARACLFKRKERIILEDDTNNSNDHDHDDDVKGTVRGYEAVDFNDYSDDEIDSDDIAIAAQIEVLYDVTQEFVSAKSAALSSSMESCDSIENDDEVKPDPTSTIVSVVTLERWLHNSHADEGELRWRLASYRPPYEFKNLS